MEEDKDCRVVLMEGAPISLKKVSENLETKPYTILVDGSGSGFVNDDPSLLNVTIAEREIQAMYFLNLGLSMPAYLKKYLMMLYKDDEKRIDELYPFAVTNDEMKQCIGMIQLVAGILSAAKKANKGVRLYIEKPETHLHPAKQSAMMSVLVALGKEYGPTETTPIT